VDLDGTFFKLILVDENVTGVLEGGVDVLHADVRGCALFVPGRADTVDWTISHSQVSHGDVLHQLDIVIVVLVFVHVYVFGCHSFGCVSEAVGCRFWLMGYGLLRTGR
jgi:hypothetical protein